jgi:hypothetical protein
VPACIVLMPMAWRHARRGITGREVARVHGAPRRALQLAEDQSHREQHHKFSGNHYEDSTNRIHPR